MLKLIRIFHQQTHAVGGGSTGTFVAANHDQNEHPGEHLFGHLDAINLAFQQRLHDLAGGVLALLLGQLHGVHDHFHGYRIALVRASGHIRVVGKGHHVGPLKELLAVFLRHAQYFQYRNQRQLGGHVFNKLALAFCRHAVNNSLGLLAQPGFHRRHGTRGKGVAHHFAVLHVLGRVHGDNEVFVHDLLDFLLLRRHFHREGAGFGGGKQVGVLRDKIQRVPLNRRPVRYTVVRVVEVDERTLLAQLAQIGIRHAFDVGIQVQQVGERTLTHKNFPSKLRFLMGLLRRECVLRGQPPLF